MTQPAASHPGLPPHRKVRVDLGPRSYDVVIGRGLLGKCAEWAANTDIKGPVTIISDSTVAGLYAQSLGKLGRSSEWAANVEIKETSVSGIAEPFAQRIRKLLEGAEFDSLLLEVPAGEGSKSMAQMADLHSELAKMKMPRSGTLIGLGGGVVGDLVGFVAATYLRGIAFVQVPTTLLAMVDSSVGGKTGVNLPEGKNLVGAFHQPKLVVADLDTLQTLPATEFAAGMAEVIKYGAIKNKTLFDRVASGVKPDDKDLDEIVEMCVKIKARIVEKDEFETKGDRALLNFGHTIGHAIEKATGYKTYLHGEAIALGMRAAAWLSVWQAGLPEADARRIENALKTNHLPITIKPEVDRSAILGALGNDKKVAADGKNRWVLLKKLGEATSGWELPADQVEKAVELLRSP
ncbi:MAG: 3-dehydroquinate synthase [Methylacidiphilales bacterium]|nr:3-dehydroquinate synthase [Candidatus Methylacidiphilales bacterium]